MSFGILVVVDINKSKQTFKFHKGQGCKNLDIQWKEKAIESGFHITRKLENNYH